MFVFGINFKRSFSSNGKSFNLKPLFLTRLNKLLLYIGILLSFFACTREPADFSEKEKSITLISGEPHHLKLSKQRVSLDSVNRPSVSSVSWGESQTIRSGRQKITFEKTEINYKKVKLSPPVLLEIKGTKVRAKIPEMVPLDPFVYDRKGNRPLSFLSKKEGLPQNHFWSVFADSYEDLWFCSSGAGVIRYNGLFMQEFNQASGLGSDMVRTGIQDENGHYWFGTWGGGLIYFDGRDFVHYNEENGFPFNYILSIYQDQRGSIWIGTWNKGLVKFNGKDFYLYTKKEGLPSDAVTSIQEDGDGHLWFSTYLGGIFQWNEKEEIHVYDQNTGLKSNDYWKLGVDSANRVWLGSSGGGLSILEGNTLLSNQKDFHSVQTIKRDGQGKIWAGSEDDGLYHFIEKSDSNQLIAEHYNQFSGLQNPNITDVHCDANGNKWISTWGGGMHRLLSYDMRFIGEQEGLQDDIIWHIQESEGRLLLATDNQGLIQLNKENLNWTSQKLLGLAAQKVRYIYSSRDFSKYLGTWETGVIRIKNESQTIWGEDQGVSNNVILAISENQRGQLALAADAGGGLCLLDPKSNKVLTIQEKDGFPDNLMRIVLNDSQDRLWAGTWEGGLVLKTKQDQFYHFTDSTGISSNCILTLFEDQEKRIWVGTKEGGLLVYENDQFHRIDEENSGLLGNSIYAIVQDPKGNHWVSTNKGLNLIRYESNNDFKILQIGNDYGLRDAVFKTNAAYADTKGILWFGTDKGLLRINPRDFEFDTTLSKLQIDAIWTSQGDLTDNKESIELEYDANAFTVYPSFKEIRSTKEIEFAYTLDGWDRQWYKSKGAEPIAYRNLPEGEYTLQIKAKNAQGNWSETTTLSIRIWPPWYRTIWAYVSYLIILILLIYGILKWRTRQLIKKQKELENIVEIRTKEVVEQKSEAERQRDIAQEQKELVEEKNEEILDSIKYAKRLQDAILPPKRIVKEYLADSFILYVPKDIVAGDFYWMETAEVDGEHWIYFAAADCTGHGVPGAMVSVVCSNALTKALIEEGRTETGAILDRARELVLDRFGRGDEEIKDGMDISLCAVNWDRKIIKWSGANNPFWIIRKGIEHLEPLSQEFEGRGKVDTKEDFTFVDLKANKQPVGKYAKPEPFTTHEIQLQAGDSFYMFSDGFPDQFGGEKGKKFKTANFKRLLVSVQELEMEEQRKKINEVFEEWRGSIEQIDDVCVIGVRV